MNSEQSKIDEVNQTTTASTTAQMATGNDDVPVIFVQQDDMTRLQMQRNHAANRIKHIVENMDVFQGDVTALETRRDMLKDNYKNFDQAQSSLEQMMPEQEEIRDEIEVRYITGLSLFGKAIHSAKSEKPAPTNRDSVRLPTVDLPVFSGAGENWLEWFDKFDGLIHQRSTLPTIQKFEYLKLSLKGPALGVIDSLPTTEANYAVAYDMLIKRYNNPKLLVQKHTRELFELKSIEVESAPGLRNLFDTARKHLRCLESLKQPVESWDAVLIHLMANKLDPITRREWESASSGSTPPSYSLLEKFVTDRCQMLDAMPTKRLGIPTTPTQTSVTGFGQHSKPVREKAIVSFKSRVSSYNRTVPMLVTDTITGSTPHTDVNIDHWDLSDVSLADPEFFLSRPVDMLLGVSIVFDIFRNGNREIADQLPLMQNTTLGWVIGGGETYLKANREITTFINENTNSLLSRKLTEEEATCEQLFEDTTSRNSEGRFVVRLPRKQNADQLGDSKSLALERLLRLEKRFDTNPELHQQYSSFMREYIKLGHMTKVHEDELAKLEKCGPVYYSPHHPVLRPESTTTKLRVVFNGSAASSSGLSLNDVLMTGPTIQQDTFNILLRFRFPRYVLVADLEKMFRQILVSESDSQLQLILFRFSNEDAVATYRLNTVTYGTCSAPYIAARCLKQLAIECRPNFPDASQIIEEDFYMDDMLTGRDDPNELMKLKEEVTSILESAGFHLHKWKSNSSEVIPDDHGADEVKILGLRWNSKTDMFSFHSDINFKTKVTKRNVLSEIQKIYDPLGIISPIIVHGKLIMQNIWTEKLDWDDQLPEQMASKWKWFCDQVSEIQNISFPRHTTNSGNSIELHGFADASKNAYGAVIYVRSISESGVQVNLLCAKSRITPKNEKGDDENTTIPRLELRAATLLVELMAKVTEAMTVKIDGVFYWTDSMVVLDWISYPKRRRPQFITNRVNKINEMSSISDWYHVRSEDNPADPISRGTSAKKLAHSSLWWYGPKFLIASNKPWVQERTESLVISATAPQELEPCDISDYSLIDRFSSFTKLQRVLAYCLRFKKNCLTRKPDRQMESLTLDELKRASNHIIRMSQRKHFYSETQCLAAKKALNKTSSLITLHPFLDKDGILRVGGRIQAAGVNYDQQHPIILPAKCNVTELIAANIHRSHLHVGQQGLLYAMRLNYWPIHGRSLTRKIVHRCITCYRNNPKPLQQVMGQIPNVRLTPGRPFENCGVDFGGPFTIKENFVRTQKTLKVYVALFICLRTRAVHLELVSYLSSAAFIAALRRFSSQRGISATIYCDNGTNFVGSKTELKRLTEQFNHHVAAAVRDYCVTEGTEWKFIPPRSPNFGGIWEAGIKSVKHHMKRVLGSSVPTYEEMLTLLKQIEGCLNSRPISPLSADARDPNPLTPGHFLVGGPIMALPDRNLCDVPSNRLSRYEEVQRNLQLFWKRWQVEYINNLQQRNKKWSSTQPDLTVGQLCLIKEDNMPPFTWITGRVVKIHPGPDGHVRVATLLTTKGEIKRSISKLCVLPIDDMAGGGNM